MRIVFGVCTGSWEKLTANVVPVVGNRPLVAVSGQTSIALAYNIILDAALDMDADVLVLQHDDLEIIDPLWEEKTLAALEPGVGIIGVAGGMNYGGIGWWAYAPIGHQRTDARELDFGTRSGTVDSLEGSLLIFSKKAIQSVAFDMKYPGFHGYDVDICSQVQSNGLEVRVVDIDTWHHTRMGYKSEASHLDWCRADERFRAKWGPP